MSTAVPPPNPTPLGVRRSGPTLPFIEEQTRPARPRWMLWMTLGILLLTATLVFIEFGRTNVDTGRIQRSAVVTRIIDASFPANDVRVIVRPMDGRPAKDYMVRPLGQTAEATDVYGESCLDTSCRGCSADIFDPRGEFIATVTIPLTGHLIVEIRGESLQDG